MEGILQEYNNGSKIIDLARKYHKRQSFVSSLLKSKGVKIRTSRHVDWLNYELDHEFFSKINTPQKAYLLGIMWSDGCVASISNTISLICNDLDLINFFRKQIRCTKKIYRNPNHSKAKTFSFCSPRMKEDLLRLGCVPRKSLILKYPVLPKALEKYFLLGLFDGDGCVTQSRQQLQAYFLGTIDVCKNIQRFLTKNKIQTNRLQKNGKIWRLRITGDENLKSLYSMFYTSPPFFLQRKKKAFENYGNLHLSTS